MRNQISCPALALALLAGTTAANAQTMITRDISGQPVETVVTQQPVETGQTVVTTRTLRPGRTIRRRVVTTTRQTVVSQRAVAPQPLYDVEPDRILVIDPATNIAIQADAPRGCYSGSFLAPSVTALGSTSR